MVFFTANILVQINNIDLNITRAKFKKNHNARKPVSFDNFLVLCQNTAVQLVTVDNLLSMPLALETKIFSSPFRGGGGGVREHIYIICHWAVKSEACDAICGYSGRAPRWMQFRVAN